MNRAAPVAMAEREMPRSSKDRGEIHDAITKQVIAVLYRWRLLARTRYYKRGASRAGLGSAVVFVVTVIVKEGS
jgi:hypothetical protein